MKGGLFVPLVSPPSQTRFYKVHMCDWVKLPSVRAHRVLLIFFCLFVFVRTILSVWIGTQANDIIKMLKGNEEQDLNRILLIALFVFSVLGLYIIFMKAIKKYNNEVK